MDKKRGNTSHLLQHASKFGLKRSLTTKVFTSPQIQQPRLSVSFSSTQRSNTSLQKSNECTPSTSPIPFLPDNGDTSSSGLLHHQESTSSRALSPIPENTLQSLFPTTVNRQPLDNRACLSTIAYEFKRRIILSDRIKNGIEYHNVFDGKEATDKLKEVLGITDRTVALKVGRALESQRFFHDVNYENRLVDDIIEIYQFNELLFRTYSNSNSSASFSVTSTIVSDDDDEEEDDYKSTTTNSHQVQDELQLPNGIYVDLTRCFTPTCNNLYPCYSYTCPKKERLRNRPHSLDTREKRVTAYINEIEKHQPLWSQKMDESIVMSTPSLERKRQETIFELIYTELNFLNDLDYITKMWIEPLKQSDIIPIQRRDEFIENVFSNIIEIRNISTGLSIALRSRQQEHPIVSQVSDILERFVAKFEPYVYYGARQHRAKHIFEREFYINPRFASFAQKTERDVASRKLELNGYLTKPTTRLGRYNLLLDKIHDYTTPNHPDKENIPFIIDSIKCILQKVNAAAGVAKNRFDLDVIASHLTWRNKRDTINLRLKDENRWILKQGMLRKSQQSDSSEYQVILFDHYLVIAKVKIIHAIEYYIIQKRPIPIELLGIKIENTLPLQRKRSSSTLLFNVPSFSERVSSSKISPDQAILQVTRVGLPITFYHQGGNANDNFTLYAVTDQSRKSWNTAIQKQREIKFKRKPVFDVVDTVKRYEFFIEITVHQMVLYDQGKHYMLATDAGVYVGPYKSMHGIPRKILPLEKVSKIHILEEYQLLLVLSDQTLWQFPLDITLNGHDSYSIQNFGRKIRTNVRYFHVGACIDRILICVPKPSTVHGTEIDLYEPTMPRTELKKKSLLGRLSIRSTNLSLTNTQVNHLKPIYSPCDVWAIDTTNTLIFLTTPMGIIAVDMKTKRADALLDPTDKHLEFITRNEKTDDVHLRMNPAIKHISVFLVPNGNYLVCYDKYAFYINKKGKRAQHEFKIEWEGQPTSFAYYHPHIIAFEQHFIEIRSVIDGHLQQIIQEKNVCCLQNGHKLKESIILGTMLDKSNTNYQHIFELQPIRG